MTDREDGPGGPIEDRLRAWGDWARESTPLPQPLSIPQASGARRIWPGLLAAVLLVAVASVTAVTPRLSHHNHQAPPAKQQPTINTGLSDGLGYYNLIDGTFHLRRSATEGGPSDFAYKFGPVGANIQPLAGDWNGDGKDGIGYYNPADGTVHLRNDATRTGPSDYAYVLTKTPNAHVIVGDWNGDGKDGIGYWVPEPGSTPNSDGAALMYLRDDATRFGAISYSFPIPRLGADQPYLFAGDWTGTGHAGLADAEIDCVCAQGSGLAELYLDRDAVNGFQTAYQLSLHPPGDISPPFAGDWNGSGKDGIGYYNYADQTVHLRNDATTEGLSDYAYRFAIGNRPVGPNVVLLAGNW